MNKFISNIALFILPLSLFLSLYIYIDPFKVIKNYDEYLSEYVMLHRGFISTKVFLKNVNRFKYDSFIFGSSRSCSHTSKEWKRYLSKDNSPYSYGSWNESIEGIYKKIKLIDSLNISIKNALIIIDGDRTFINHGTNPIERDHFLISGKSRLEFHLYYFTRYLNLNLIRTSIYYKINNKQKPYMKNFIGMKTGDLDTITNDWLPNSENEIINDSVNYYSEIYKYYNRPKLQGFYSRNIDDFEVVYLKKIMKVFIKDNTNFKIIIAPLYDQKKLDPKDLDTINTIFGEKNVYDFSGINEITNNIFNYSKDVEHYRKKVGNIIFSLIYNS